VIYYRLLDGLGQRMGYNQRNDEIRDNVERMRRDWEAQRGALATVRRFNATLSAKGYVWFWPKIAAALTAKHHWLVIACDSCGTVIDLDRPRITALARHPSI
jgi:hypothetical protein